MTHESTLAPAPSVPANVVHAAAAAGLGEWDRTVVPQKRSWFVLVGLLIFGLVSVIGLIGFWFLWLLIRTPNLSRSQAARRIYLYDHGFIVADKPEDPQVYRWDTIDSVFQKVVSQRAYGVETAKNYLYTITRRDGRTVKLTQFWSDIAEVGPTINERTSATLLPGALNAIGQGQGVTFADLTLSANGIAGRRKSVDWREVSQIQLSGGYVRIGVSGKLLPLSNTAAANIPNLPLFLTLAERLREERRR